MVDLSSVDLEELSNALADQTDYEHRWLINPQSQRTHLPATELLSMVHVASAAILCGYKAGESRCLPRHGGRSFS